MRPGVCSPALTGFLTASQPCLPPQRLLYLIQIGGTLDYEPQ
jgi:hypothetical protein